MGASLLIPATEIRVQSVLIATDFTKASEKPLRHALAIARHYGAKFYLAHVVSSLGLTMAGPEAIADATDAVVRDAHRLEEHLVESGALAGVRHEILVRHGVVCEELEKIITEQPVDLVVIGTHGRRGLGKLLLGSVSEQIFRHADCPVLTVGPGSYEEAPVEGRRPIRPFLFATDFSQTSLHALPYAVSFANHFQAKLVFLHVIPEIQMPEGFHLYTADDVVQVREKTRLLTLKRLRELAAHAQLKVEPEFLAEFGVPSEQILQASANLKVDAIAMGLDRSKHRGDESHLPWATAYDVVCGASCPVLTVRS